MFLASQHVQWLIRRGPWLCLAGVLLLVLAVNQLRDIGFVSGLMLLLFGVCTLAFRAWLTERGLWMLAALALAAWLPLYAFMEWDAIKREFNAQNPRLFWLSLDTTVATLIVWLQLRFLATVIRCNRQLPRRA
jgi:hypothetical protein